VQNLLQRVTQEVHSHLQDTLMPQAAHLDDFIQVGTALNTGHMLLQTIA